MRHFCIFELPAIVLVCRKSTLSKYLSYSWLKHFYIVFGYFFCVHERYFYCRAALIIFDQREIHFWNSILKAMSNQTRLFSLSLKSLVLSSIASCFESVQPFTLSFNLSNLVVQLSNFICLSNQVRYGLLNFYPYEKSIEHLPKKALSTFASLRIVVFRDDQLYSSAISASKSP